MLGACMLFTCGFRYFALDLSQSVGADGTILASFQSATWCSCRIFVNVPSDTRACRSPEALSEAPEDLLWSHTADSEIFWLRNKRYGVRSVRCLSYLLTRRCVFVILNAKLYCVGYPPHPRMMGY